MFTFFDDWVSCVGERDNPSVSCADSSLYTREPLESNKERFAAKGATPQAAVRPAPLKGSLGGVKTPPYGIIL